MKLPALISRSSSSLRVAVPDNRPTTRAASGLKDFEHMLVEAAERAPMGQLADIMDVGAVCSYLASRHGERITGGTVYVDGGTNIVA